ncbi:MAG TPA: M50 family metallopeptidase [Anaerolineales bacterium]|nr:M50 family metallopeptidase [Anaerolineales bacterium]
MLSTTNVWDRLASELVDPELLPESRGLWGEITPRPGGLWQSAGDETLAIGRKSQTLWTALNDSTMVWHPGRNIWNIVNQISEAPVEDNVWETLDNETLVLPRGAVTVWKKPAVRDLARVKLRRGDQWALKELKSAKGETYWVLKHLVSPVYLRLDEQQLFLWNMLDGSHTVQDLAVECFVKYGTLNIEWLTGFLTQLGQKGFLSEARADVYQDAQQQEIKRSVRYKVLKVIGLIFQSELGIPVDGFYTFLYKSVGWILYTRLFQILFVAVTLLGVPAYFIVSGANNVLTSATGTDFLVQTGLVSLIVAQVIVFFIHESSHALTVCHYGRHVRRGGVGLYFGMVAFFMDTTDIWMEPRGPRLAVTWAGPYSGFILGGIGSLLLFFFPHTAGAQLAYQMASIGYLVSIGNMNPLLKFDGYYMLTDWLEMPRLRERSLEFVKSGVWKKIKAREHLNKEETILLIFGLAAFVYTGIMIALIIWTFGSSIYTFFQSLIGGKLAL